MRFARYAWCVLAYNLAVVLWGAFVRATGSGAGCGNHWPLCNGEVLPHSPSLQRAIEFGHRTTSGLDLVLVAIMVVWAFRAFPRGHAVRRGATLSGVFLISEAAVGAALVLFEYVAQNASIARAYWDCLHLTNTLTLLACLTLTAWWAGGKPSFRLRGKSLWTAVATLVSVVGVAITGTISALGDTLFPARSLSAGLAQDFNPASNVILRLRALHPPLAGLIGACVLLYAITRAANDRPVRRIGYLVGLLALVQVAVGMLNLFLLAPIGMQLIHLLIADLLWITLVLLVASPEGALE